MLAVSPKPIKGEHRVKFLIRKKLDQQLPEYYQAVMSHIFSLIF